MAGGVDTSCAGARRCRPAPSEPCDELGATEARTVKPLARPGMGWCQGRTCGYATAELTARACGRPVNTGDLAAFAHRPIATPVRLGELAAEA